MSSNPEWDGLLLAARNNHTNKLMELLHQGANVNHGNVIQQTSLHVASLWGNVESVQLLLEKKWSANVHAANSLTGATPLHMAIQSNPKVPLDNRLAVVKLLVQHGASPTVTDHQGVVPLDLEPDPEKRRHYLDILEAHQAPPAFVAVHNRSLSQFRDCYLDNDSSVCYYNGQSLLDCIIQAMVAEEESVSDGCGLYEMLTLVVVEGGGGAAKGETVASSRNETVGPVNVLLRAMCTCSQPDTAVYQLWEQSVSLLIDHGHDFDTTCLHVAARRGREELVQFLLPFVDVNARGRQNMTALQFAARSGKINVVRLLLLKYQADRTLKDDRGQTALDAARVNGHDEIVRLLDY